MNEMTIIPQEDGKEPRRDFSRGYLTIPFEGDQFKHFISSLLGRPQKITRVLSGSYEIHLGDIQSLHQLIDQRICNQNRGSLTQLSSKIFFDDGSSVQLGSLKELESYNEVKPIVSKVIKLTWTYLIQFPEKQHPEKQIIEVFIHTGKGIDTDEFISFDEEYINPRTSFIGIHIEHTNRTWGYDIENLITTQLKSIIEIETNKFRKWLVRNQVWVGLCTFSLLIALGIYGFSFITNKNRLNAINSTKKFISNNAHNLNQKLEYVSTQILNAEYDDYIFGKVVYTSLIFTSALLSGIICTRLLSKLNSNSYLILTRKSRELLDKQKKKDKWIWVKFVVMLMVNLAIGILSTFIYEYLITS